MQLEVEALLAEGRGCAPKARAADHRNPGVAKPLHERELARLERLARMLDASIGVPGTGFRFGLDAIVGLIPGVGDVATLFISLWIIYRSWRLGAKTSTVLRMFWNVSVDLLIGLVPVAGDLFDAAWKSNLRNVVLLRQELQREGRQR